LELETIVPGFFYFYGGNMLQIEYLKTTELREYEKNAKIHDRPQIEDIKNSITAFGMNDPIAVWKNNLIIEGHGRLKACQELGIEEVPVIRLDHLTDQQRKSIVQEYNPEIRIETITKAFELVLSLISMGFGYGTKKYKFENGEIQTATEYIGERQDQVQELNKQRKQATDYITDLIHAMLWFSNAFQGTAYNVEEPITIEFDDSYIEDKTSNLESMRTDALSFPGIPELTVRYLIEKYNYPEEEARKMVGATLEEEEAED